MTGCYLSNLVNRLQLFMLTFQKPLMLFHMPSYLPDYTVMVFEIMYYFG